MADNEISQEGVSREQKTFIGVENGKATPEDGPETEISKKSSTQETTFKTPSFVIPSKKKVQSDTEMSKVFKLPEKPGEKSKAQDSEMTEPAAGVSVEKDNKVEKPSGKVPALSPAEQLKLTQAAVPYKEPPWSSLCEQKYSLEVIKNGAVIDKIDLTTKSFHIIGRIPSCDIPMEHPSLSRYHAVIQYSGGGTDEQPKGWYLYDLDSTHGTWINKHKVPPNKYHKLHVDYVLKFGGSTRLFIMQGPDDDRMEESELSVTEMKEQREKHTKEAELIRQAEMEEAERKAELIIRKEEEKGCSWGIDEDAEDEDETEENPFAKLAAENEQLYVDDPKKSLNGYFEREGYDPPEYDFTETGIGKWKCSVELPVDSPTGEPLKAEVIVSGKKKEAVVVCALEACRMLDRLGELRKSKHESRKKKQKNWEEDDFYDSDEDVYLDRTGAIEKKREYRKKKVGKSEETSDTYDSLLERHTGILAEIEEISQKLEKAKAQAAALESEDIDALDAYMSAIKSGMMDTKTKMKLKRQLMELKQEEQKIRKLVNIAKPTSLPELAKKPESGKHTQAKPSILSGVGKMKGPAGGKIVKKNIPSVEEKLKLENEDLEEVEEDQEEEEKKDMKEIGISKDSEKAELETKRERDDEASVAESLRLSDSERKAVNTKSVTDNVRRVKGPSLPLAAVLEQLQSESMESEPSKPTEDRDDNEEGVSKTVAKRKRAHQTAVSKKKKPSEGSYDSSNPDYATWLPPDSQSGDGKTHLNKRFGY